MTPLPPRPPRHRKSALWFLLLPLVILTRPDGSAVATPFTHEYVDGFMSFTSIAVDARNQIHLAYTGPGGLHYAVRVNGLWTTQVLDANGTGQVSLRVDSNGVPNIAYVSAGKLNYATPTAGVWSSVIVDNNTTASGPSIAIGPTGEPRISYIRSGLRYAKRTGGVWASSLIDAAGGGSTSLAVTKSDNSRIAYTDAASNALRHADGLFLETVDNSLMCGFPSIALDRQENSRIAYKAGANDVRFAEHIPNSLVWTMSTVGSSVARGDYCSLVLDTEDHPHVAYAVNPTVLAEGEYATRPGDFGTAWSVESIISNPGSISGATSICLDWVGNPVIGYSTQRFGTKVADSGVWLRGAFAGSDLLVGDDLTVSWGGTGPVSIQLSSDGGASYQTLLTVVESSPVTVPVPHTPTHFARLRIDRVSPRSTDITESFFSIHVTVALLSIIAQEPPLGTAGAVVTWRTDPGPEHFNGYRLERSTAGSEWATVVPLTRETSYSDASAGPATRYRLFVINGLGEEMLLGETSFRPRTAISAWPLPFRGGSLSVAFATHGGLGGGSSPAQVSVFDATGRLIRTIASGDYPAGYQTVAWDGRDSRGTLVSAGVYFLRAASAGDDRTMKFVVLR